MGISAGPNSISDNLAFHIDPANPRSYAGVGTVIYDLSGNGKTSYFTNGAFYQNYSKGVVVLDGNDDYISTPTFSLTSSITVSVWVKNAIRNGRVFGYSTSPDDFLFQIAATQIIIRINTVNSGGTFPSANFNIWTNLVLTRDGSSVNKYYRDGIASSVVGGVTGTIIFDQIGRYSNSVGANNIKGSIGEVKVYNRELSASEVLQNYNASKSKYNVVENIVKNGLVLNIDAANSSSYSNPLTYTGTGLTAYDLSGFGNTATLVNGTGFTGTNGGAFLFDATDDYISMGTASSVKPTQLTLACFFKINAIDAVNVVAGKQGTGSGAASYAIVVQSGQLHFRISNSSGTEYNASTAFSNTSSYNYAVGTYDGSNLRLYLNGASAGSSSVSISIVYSDSYPLLMGYYGNSIPTNMSIGSLKLYNRALSDTEIQQNFNAMRERYNI
jgi:hypothetical protein